MGKSNPLKFTIDNPYKEGSHDNSSKHGTNSNYTKSGMNDKDGTPLDFFGGKGKGKKSTGRKIAGILTGGLSNLFGGGGDEEEKPTGPPAMIDPNTGKPMVEDVAASASDPSVTPQIDPATGLPVVDPTAAVVPTPEIDPTAPLGSEGAEKLPLAQ